MNLISTAVTDVWRYLNSAELLNTILSNRFFLILLVVMILCLKRRTYRSMFLAALINIPGTILHETAHFIVGLLLFPKKSGDTYTMGSVGFRNIAFYNAFPSAMAPLALLWAAFWFNNWYLTNAKITIWNYLVFILLETVIIENAVPSSTDFRVAFSRPLGILLYGFLLAALIVWL